MDGQALFQGLLSRGYDPVHAAALAGHMIQESGGNPADVNKNEDAHGLLQWRLDRWKGLQDYAAAQNKSPTDPDVQMDYIAREMSGPEAKSSTGFRNATDLPSASAALKDYIRFGDDSAGTRLQNARAIFSGAGMLSPASTQSASMAPAASSSTGTAPAASSSPAQASDDQSTLAALQNISKLVQQQQQPQPMAFDFSPTPAMMRSRQLAAALLQAQQQQGAPPQQLQTQAQT